MDIAQAKQQVKDTVEAYLENDAFGDPIIPRMKQRPIFLIGAPGIGKTAIVGQVAAEMGIGFISYSMTHHTRQSALGLPFIVEKEYGGSSYRASEYTMSEIIASIYDYMAATSMTTGILFLDEINCVSETLYPSMLQFLQFKTFGRHEVPAGWIIVTAGNPAEYNRNVHEFDIVTLDRVKRIQIEPDLKAWKAYATDVDVHPSILAFIGDDPERFYTVKTKLEGRGFVTARGWEDLSDIISLYEKLGKTVDFGLIVQYLQDDDIASRFATYYELFVQYRSDYQVEDILRGIRPEGVMERVSQAPFDERLALDGLLLDALTSRMRQVCEKEDALKDVRDRLRRLKEAILAGETDAASALGDEIEQVRPRHETQAQLMTPAQRRCRQSVTGMLEKLRADVIEAGRPDGQEAFEIIRATFRATTSTLSDDVASVQGALGNLLVFCEEAYGEGQESLMVMSELSTRRPSVLFLTRFGSEEYFSRDDELLIREREAGIARRAAELGL